MAYVGARHGDEEVGEVITGDVGVPGSGALACDHDSRLEFLLECFAFTVADEKLCVVWLEVMIERGDWGRVRECFCKKRILRCSVLDCEPHWYMH